MSARLVFGWVTLLLVSTLTACMQGPSLPPDIPPVSSINGPVLPENPSQSDRGALVYWQICEACHGNQGQGLTDEWRASWGEEDMNCWQSKCHAANHPPWGFQLPRESPALVGTGTMMLLSNGLELYNLIYTTMPWWNPESLSDEQAWDVSAYLMKANGVLPEDMELNPVNASAIPLHPASPPAGSARPAVALLVILLAAAAVAFAADSRLHGKARSSPKDHETRS